jgi:hypothetical protein
MHSGPISRSIDSGIVNVRPQRALVPNDEFRTDPGGAEEEVELPSKPPRRNLPFLKCRRFVIGHHRSH